MKYYKVLTFLFLFFNLLHASSVKNVLILNSYHKGYELSDTIIKNIEKVFYNNKDINTNVLYMDAKQIYTRAYIKKLNELYTLQLQNKRYDLIIALDKYAYKFVVKNYKHLFKEEKILFLGVEQYSKELAKIYQLEEKISGIIHKTPIKENISLILKLKPKLKKLYILNDRSLSANDTSSFIIEAMQEIPRHIEAIYLRDESLEELKATFKAPKQDEAILFVQYANSSQGEYYRTNELALAIEEFALPVFATNSLFLNKGVVGGALISIDKLGSLAGNEAVYILEQKDAPARIQTYAQYQNTFDYEKLQAFRLAKPPKNSLIINTPRTFFEEHRSLINAVFLGTPLLFVIIFGLLHALHAKQVASNKLQERLAFDKALLNAIDSPIFWQDAKGIILDMNTGFCQLLNLSYEALLGRRLEDFLEQNPNIKKLFTHLLHFQIEGLEASELKLLDAKGQKRVYFINQTAFSSKAHQNGVVTIFTDITEEKKAQVEKIKQNQYLIQHSKMAEIGEVFSSIAHQWKSPLVAITALAQDMFYSSNSTEKEEDNYHIQNIMLQANYMTDTINDFQDFIIPSKKRSVFDAHKTIERMLNIVRHNIKYNYINLNLHLEKEVVLLVYGYENEFMQAVLNLVNNAKEALQHKREKERDIDIFFKNKCSCLVIDIIDNGLGVQKEHINKIFLQYFSTKEKGHGIGLYMTRLIIQDKLGGKIICKQRKSGSHFRILLKTHKEQNL